MKSFVRFCQVSVVLVALAFFCQGLQDNFFSEPDNNETAVLTSTDSLTDPTQSEHSFIKFNTACLTSPTAEGQTVAVRAGVRRTELDFRILESKAFCHLNVQRHSLPTLRKLRL